MRLILYSSFFSLLSVIAEGCGCDDNVDPSDDPKNILRPCPDFNMDCIRDYFWNNAQCEITTGPTPDPIVVDHYNFMFPHANMSMNLFDINVRGLNGDIVEFYINRKTRKLVIAVEMQCLRFDSPDIIFKYHRKGKENIIRRDYGDASYGTTTMTAVFPCITNLDLDQMTVFTYVDDSNLVYTIGSNLHANLNPAVYKQYRKFITNMPLNILEKFITQGKIYMSLFIQHNICNFGYDATP